MMSWYHESMVQDPVVSPSSSSILPPKDPTIPEVANFEVFEVKIVNQVGVVFNGEASALASANNKGEFSILPGHTNFISLITQPVMLYPPQGQPKKFEVGLGILRCLHNRVEIFTGLLVDKETQAMAASLQANKPDDKGFLGLNRFGELIDKPEKSDVSQVTSRAQS